MISNRAIIGTAIAAIIAGVLAIILFQVQSAPDDEEFERLTPEEQSEYENKAPRPGRALSILAEAGPKAGIAAPKGFTLSSPADFDIRAAPRDAHTQRVGIRDTDKRVTQATVAFTVAD